ncbi:tetratricopeptide repeat protein [Sulfurimonas sp. HSL-1716]|uniref:tetratricopeptide repeat protein n=1 Tax=Hydrocurvibacter sulfurireducens TaxID=3131937 RepID=UPI0031F8ABF5
MTLFQILMLGLAAFFSYKVYQHVQNLEESGQNKKQGQRSQNGFSPFDPPQLVKKADEAFLAGDLKRAFALLDEANVKDPKNADILGKMGYISAQEARDNEAVSYYKEALSIDKYNDTMHNALASLLRKQGDFSQAEEHYKKALAIDAGYDVTYFNYANLLTDMNRYDEALKMYEKALELNPELKEAEAEIQKIKEKV